MFKKILIGCFMLALFGSSIYAQGRNSENQSLNTTTTLTQKQKDVLLFMYQEEKVARDVYKTFGLEYPNQTVFQNIQLSEQKHMDSVQILCEKYGVDISNIDESLVGYFVVSILQELYDTLLAQGYQSELSFLMVGEYIEITDIDDLESASIGMPDDVVKVFDNLKSGSFNHLDAFRSAIDSYK